MFIFFMKITHTHIEGETHLTRFVFPFKFPFSKLFLSLDIVLTTSYREEEKRKKIVLDSVTNIHCLEGSAVCLSTGWFDVLTVSIVLATCVQKSSSSLSVSFQVLISWAWLGLGMRLAE